MTSPFPFRRSALAVVAVAIAFLILPRAASAQLGAVGPYGAYMNYGYYGGSGPYGWGPYAFGWAGHSVVGVGPVQPPLGGPMVEYTSPVVGAPMPGPPSTAALLQQQAMAARWRDHRRQTLEMKTRFDVNTGRPRFVPARVVDRPQSLEQRIEALFTPEGVIAWPSGMSGPDPAARRDAEQAAQLALEQFRDRGQAKVADVNAARRALSDYAAPIFARLAATDDPLSFETVVDFFERLDAILIDLADPPAEESPAPADGPPAEPTPNTPER